jgi:lipid A ethanolaminephosphotransferase
MMMWASADYWQNQHLNLSCLQHAAKTASLSHDYVFHSLLRALNIQTKEYTKQLDMFNICPNAAQNKY